jgi:hypothetical protein
VRRSKELPFPGQVPAAQLETLARTLAAAAAFGRDAGELRRDAEADALWGDVYGRLSAPEAGMVGAIIARAEAQVLRLSALYAVLDRSALVRAPHLFAALALWDYAETSARRIFRDLAGDPVADTVHEALRTGPMTLTEIHRVLGGHVSAQRLDAALATLEKTGRARREMRGTTGRPAEVWSAQ